MQIQTYACNNEHCSLGARGSYGVFTGGLSHEQRLLFFGEDNGASGEGVCPNCGEKGVKDSVEERVYSEPGGDPVSVTAVQAPAKKGWFSRG